MGLGVFGSVLVLVLLFKHLESQQPNTDEFFVSGFLKHMSLTSSRAYNFSASVCSWQGVSCDANREHVVGLVFSGMNLSGTVPDNTIGKLGKLQTLDLSHNKITGLPSDFWSLSSLTNLNLSSNHISSSLTSNIGNFGLLESIDLSSNNFSEEIPETVCSLLNLRVLKLNHNRFAHNIPYGILKCQSLVSIDLSSNQLNGTLPEGFGASFPKLRILNLAGNNFNGRVSDISGLKSIANLNISGNSFQGSIVDMFQGRLEVLDISRNQFQGHIPQVLYNFSNWSHLVYLDLSENKLSGEFFQNLNESLNLRHINLAHNRFTIQKFPQIEILLNLEYLNLSKTSLVGEIPGKISQLSKLSALDLSLNHLSGKIPSLMNEHLRVLDLSNNNLTGAVPQSVLEKLPGMEKYNFSYNNLTLCASEIRPEILQTAFFGSLNSCPIAANPRLFKRRDTGHTGMKLALALTFSMIFVLAGLLFLAFGCRRKTKMWEFKQSSYKEEQNISGPFSFQTDSTTWVADVKQATSVPVVIFEKPLLNITFADLLAATSNFDRGTLLAEGKFGPVYRGFLPGGIHVAVKVLVVGSTLTDEEAARELEFLGRIKHPNLVPLTGYCVAGDQRIAIYDYMENGNLQNLLYDLPLGVQSTDDWSTDTWEETDNNGIQNAGSEGLLTSWRFRHKIALGTARALAFLHHGCSPPIIHRAVKASSVYLDYDLEPRLSDFGLAKIFGSGLDDEIARGSPGYVPPEFSQPEYDTPTPKSDVYCFGVVLFELVTGKKPVGDDYPDDKDATLVSWVRGLVRKNQSSNAIDPKIRDTGPDEQMEEALKIAYLCTADSPFKRPSMQQIVGLLKDIEPTAD
ncbi:hypothetical protein V8G54_017758 [Vigna mungo]|uniref:Protein kinase domain-containing protein n=1 Tax=Vigna mungo TaxID=3915 RepID=A0AAQ3NQC2_VIGMU